ncbi:MAG: 1-(5-phosphoribosyl)-5-[(5-phosphoribosylamino)methylideneamino] imidazole-4-carboxamide isomerase, partial [Acidobacteriota bacterium]
ELIPSIDLRSGRVVRLMKGDDGQRTFYEREPRQLLRDFADAGVRLAHLVDLDAAFGEAPQRGLIESLLADAPLRVELGGGLRDDASILWALGAGCERVVLGSMVARRTDEFLTLTEKFPDRLVPAVEVHRGELKVAGWVESAPITLEDLCRRLRGAACPAVLVTDVSRDGTMEGPNVELAEQIADACDLPALVSGGVRSTDDLRGLADRPRVGGVIFGRAFYEGQFTLDEAMTAFSGLRTGGGT